MCYESIEQMEEPFKTLTRQKLGPVVQDIINLQESEEAEEMDEQTEKMEEMIQENQRVVFPPCEGIGLFPLGSCMNHSCEPNCIVKYSQDNLAQLYVVRNIIAGEELTHR